MELTTEQREKVDAVKAAVREAEVAGDTVGAIVAYNGLGPDSVALELLALNELAAERYLEARRRFTAGLERCPACGGVRTSSVCGRPCLNGSHRAARRAALRGFTE